MPPSSGDGPDAPAEDARATDDAATDATIGETDGSSPASPLEAQIDREPVRYLELDWRTLLLILVVSAAFVLVFRVVDDLPASFTTILVASFLALAMNPLVRWLEASTRFHRGASVAIVLVGITLVTLVGLLLLGQKTVEQGEQMQDQLPSVLQQMTDLPFVGSTLAENDVPHKAQDWINELPTQLGQADLSQFLGTVTQGIGYVLLSSALIVMLLLDGPLLARRVRQLVPRENQARAVRIGQIVYNVVGRYFAGTLLLGFLMGVWVLITGLVLGVPLTPVLALWAGLTSMLPQIGGALGGALVIAVSLTGPHGIVTAIIMGVLFFAYMTFSNNVLLPVVVGRAINVSPPTTMLAAIGGFAVGGIIGALLAMPVVGAVKAIALEVRPLRPELAEPPDEEPPEPKRRLGLVPRRWRRGVTVDPTTATPASGA